MATAPINRDFKKQSAGPVEVLPIPPGRQLPSGEKRSPGIRELINLYAQVTANAFEVARLMVVRTWSQARRGTVHGYHRAARQTRNMAVRTQDQAIYLKREHPVRALAIVAGAAFLAGAASRIWRSRAL